MHTLSKYLFPTIKSVFFIVLFSLFSVSAEAVSLRVGETYTCTLSNVPTHFQGAQWTSSRPYDVVIQTSLTSYTTSIVVKAEKAFSGTPCVIHCEYYYLELDPTTGRYIYSRTGYQDWNIFVKENEGGGGDGGDSGGNAPTSISIKPVSETVKKGDWVDVYATVSPSNARYNLSWSVGDKTILQMSYLGKTCMTFGGLSEGTCTVTATTNNGLSSTCSITVTGNGGGSQDGGGSSTGGGSTGDIGTEMDPFPDVMIELDDVELVIGYIYKLLPKTVSVESDAEIVWTSSNDKIVRVDNGCVLALAEGTAIIKASLPKYNNKAAGAKVTVKQPKKREDVESVKTKLIDVSGHILKTVGSY